MRHCDFKDAMRWLADRIGVPSSRIDCRELDQRRQARLEALNELDEEEGRCLDIEQAFYTWLKDLRAKLPPKEEWDAKTYNRALWLDHAEDELGATSEERTKRFDQRRQAIYANK